MTRNGTCTRYLLYGGALITAAPYSSGTSVAGTALAFLYLPLIMVMITSLIIGSRRSLADFHRRLNKLGIHRVSVARPDAKETSLINFDTKCIFDEIEDTFRRFLRSFYKRDFWLIGISCCQSDQELNGA